MKPTLIDRAVAVVSPEAAMRRLGARARLEVAAAMPDLLQPSASLDERNSPPAETTWATRWFRNAPRDARSDTLPFLRLTRGASRDLARSSPIAVGAINTNVDRVVGTGLAMSAAPARRVLGWDTERALAWKQKVQAEFSLWADSTECDQAQTLNFYQQQALVFRAALESGDCFTILPDGKTTATQPYKLRIQVVEADRVGNPGGLADTPSVAGGVKIDENGAPVSYFFYDRHPGGLMAGAPAALYAGQWIERLGGRSNRRRVLHHFRKLRPDLPRGMPYLTPIIDALKQISRYTEAEIMAAVVTSYLTVFIETPTGATTPIFAGDAPGNQPNAADEVNLAPGAVVGLAPGEKPVSVDPGRPNPNFGPFINAVLVQIGMALSLPFELLIKQFNASYSASKAALLDAAAYFRNTRMWLSLSFCQPIYETWLVEAVMLGRVEAPGFFSDPLMRWAYTRAAWPGDSMGSINPKDEVAAYIQAVEARLMTRERAEWELFGSDFSDTLDQKKAEQDRLAEADLLPVPKAGAPAPQTGAAAPGAAPAPPPAGGNASTDPVKETP